MALERDQALCIRVWDWSETSQTMVLFARDLGLLRAIAKGAKRPNANFSGGLEAMTRGELFVSTRPLLKNPNALATLTAWDLQETFPDARRSLDAFYAGACLLDLVQHGLHDSDPHPQVFDAAIDALRSLTSTEVTRLTLLRFTWTLLHETGHAPELEVDVTTGEPLPSAASFAFLPHRGGFARDGLAIGLLDTRTFEKQTDRDGERSNDMVWRVRANTRDLLRQLAVQGSPSDVDATTVGRCARLLLMYFREVHRCDPHAVRTMLDSKLLTPS